MCIENNPANKTGADLIIVPLEAGGQPRPLIQERGNQGEAEISPDGRWIAYQTDESGTLQVWVRPFPNVEQGQWQVSSDGGSRPLWGRNSRELFYVSSDQRLMAVPVEAGATFSHGKPQALFDVRDNLPPGALFMPFDISLDGKRFLMLKRERPAEGTTFVAVENWFEELKRRVPTNCESLSTWRPSSVPTTREQSPCVPQDPRLPSDALARYRRRLPRSRHRPVASSAGKIQCELKLQLCASKPTPRMPGQPAEHCGVTRYLSAPCSVISV